MPRATSSIERTRLIKQIMQRIQKNGYWHAKPAVERAKLFAPYDSLVGFRQLINATTASSQPRQRRALSDEEIEALNAVVPTLQKGDRISVTHFAQNEEVTTSGIVGEVVPELSYLTVSGARLPFSAITRIKTASCGPRDRA